MVPKNIALKILECDQNDSAFNYLFSFQSSENFRKWNDKIENKVCYFPQDRNLSFFKHYSQVKIQKARQL